MKTPISYYVLVIAVLSGAPKLSQTNIEYRKRRMMCVLDPLNLTLLSYMMFQAAKSLEEKLKSSGIPYEVHIYPGCSHAFMNTSPEALKRKKGMGLTDENQEAVDLAWSRFSSWMGRFLGSA